MADVKRSIHCEGHYIQKDGNISNDAVSE